MADLHIQREAASKCAHTCQLVPVAQLTNFRLWTLEGMFLVSL